MQFVGGASKVGPSLRQMPITIPSTIFLLILCLLLLLKYVLKSEAVHGAGSCWLRGSRLNTFSNLEPENARGPGLWTLVWAVICRWPGSWGNKWASRACVATAAAVPRGSQRSPRSVLGIPGPRRLETTCELGASWQVQALGVRGKPGCSRSPAFKVKAGPWGVALASFPTCWPCWKTK